MLEKHISSFATCAACPSLCQSACPVTGEDGRKSSSPWGIMQTLSRARDLGESISAESAEPAFRCTTCRACTDACEHSVPVADVVLRARALAVEQNVEPEAIRKHIEKFHRHNNPFGQDLLAKLRKLLGAKRFRTDRKVAFFAGCTAIAKCPDAVTDAFELFDKLGVSVAPFDDPMQCCGYPLFASGAKQDFIELAEIVYQSLKRFDQVIVESPACAHTLKTLYAHYDMPLGDRIITFNTFIEPFVKKARFQTSQQSDDEILYHDPCYSARYLGETDLPRELISCASGSSPGEFHEHGQHTRCSGQGGCYAVYDRNAADHIAETRVAEAREHGAKTIVTQCPSCVHKLRQKARDMSVVDLASFLNSRFSGTRR